MKKKSSTVSAISQTKSTALALFDFDGTLTTRDSFLDFLLYSRGKIRVLSGSILLAPFLLAYKMRILSNQKAKELVLQYFFKGWQKKRFQETGCKYGSERVPQLINPGAWNTLQSHLQKGHTVVIVTASLEEYLRTWTEGQGLYLIGSRLEYKNGTITGKLKGKNCYGAEKVHRIRECFTLSNYNSIYAYGDSRGDREMLQLADHSFYRSFQ